MNRTKKLHDDLQEFQFGMLPPKTNLFVTEGPNGNLFDYYLIGVIEHNTSEYVELMQCLRSMREEDLLVLHINSAGGSVSMGQQVLAAMNDAEGYLVASIEGEACSMATQIALNCDEVVISDGSLFLVHNLSSGAIGNMVNIADTTAYLNTLNNHLASLYKTFLTEAELDLVKHGRDVTLFADEVRKRLETFEYPRRKMREAMQEESLGDAEEGVDLFDMIDERLKESIGDIGKLVSESVAKALSKYDLPVKQKPVRAKKPIKETEI